MNKHAYEIPNVLERKTTDRNVLSWRSAEGLPLGLPADSTEERSYSAGGAIERSVNPEESTHLISVAWRIGTPRGIGALTFPCTSTRRNYNESSHER